MSRNLYPSEVTSSFRSRTHGRFMNRSRNSRGYYRMPQTTRSTPALSAVAAATIASVPFPALPVEAPRPNPNRVSAAWVDTFTRRWSSNLHQARGLGNRCGAGPHPGLPGDRQQLCGGFATPGCVHARLFGFQGVPPPGL